MGQERNLTPTQHWELHQGLWHMLGCDMQLKHKDKTTAIYVDNKAKLKVYIFNKRFYKMVSYIKGG